MAQNNEQGFTTTVEKPKLRNPKNYLKNRLSEVRSQGWGNFLLNNSIYIFFIVFFVIAIIIGYTVTHVQFFELMNIFYNLNAISIIMFAALGVGSILVICGVDLSSPYIIGFLAFLSAALLQLETAQFKVFPGMGTWPILVVLIVIIILGGLFGAFHGFFVSKFKLNPFIVTLTTQIMLVSLIAIFGGFGSGQGTVREVTPNYNNYTHGSIKVESSQLYLYVFYAIFAVLITWFMWNKTKLGKNMYAVGSNPDAARVSGVNVTKTIIMIFVFAGLMYGFSAWVYGGDNAVRPDSELKMMGTSLTALDAIAACVIGGVSLTGGVGKVRNIVIGVIIIQLITFSLEMVGLSRESLYRNIIKGALILFAVAVDMRRYLTKK